MGLVTLPLLLHILRDARARRGDARERAVATGKHCANNI
jgi:hypothetical protein